MVVNLVPQGGGVSSKQVKLGDTYGDLPLPSRPGYSFNGWYEEALVTSESVLSTPCDKTLVAEWNDGIPVDMRNWSYSSITFGCLSNYTMSQNKNVFDFTGTNYWEIFYIGISLEANKTYSITFDYVTPAFGTPTDIEHGGNGAMFAGVASEIDAGWFWNEGRENLQLDKHIAIYPIQPSTSKKAIMSFTAPETKTYYFFLNFGYVVDYTIYHFEFSNFTLYTHQCSFG